MDYQEYPRHMHKCGGVFLVVDNDEQRDVALAAGWALWPVADVTVDETVPVAAPEKRKPGRPSRVPAKETV